jgi:copper resistance protein B
MSRRTRSALALALAGVVAILPVVAFAQAHDHATHAAHAHGVADTHAAHAQHPPPSGAAPPASKADDPHAAHRSVADADPHAGHAADPSAAQAPREPLPVPTEADRLAAFPPLHAGHAHASASNAFVRFNRFEAWDADPGTGQAWEGSAWIGGDTQRLWLRSEGEREHGHTAAADLEVLYGRGISAWWDLLAGVRHDFAPGPSQDWLAFGVQGMAPYKFEVSATAYLGEHGHSAFVAEAEYELLLTNRLVLQPLLEVELRGQDDAVRGTGSGLSSAEAGLRLRYEVTRRFAPYVGLVHERSFGGTADHRRASGEATRDTRWVAGVRWWF